MDNYCESMIDEGVFIRAIQYQTYVDLVKAGDENIGFASSYDLRRSWYHPGFKAPAGERMARWALATEYGKNLQWKPPMLTGHEAKDGVLELSFDTNVAGLKNWPLQGFAIAGEDGFFQPAIAQHLETGKDKHNRPQYDRKKIILSSPHVPNPVHFRYAWARNPMGNIMASQAITRTPLATQRSDSWLLSSPLTGEDAELESRAKRGKLKKMAKEADAQRKLKDAQALVEELSK